MKPLCFFYLGGAAAFFALCGYAQGNDPDPALWVSLYVFGGCVLNLLVALVIISPNAKERQLGDLVKLLCQSFLVLCLGYTVHLAYFLVQDPRMVMSKETTLLWSVLEFEEGREISGLGMLALHQLFDRDGCCCDGKWGMVKSSFRSLNSAVAGREVLAVIPVLGNSLLVDVRLLLLRKVVVSAKAGMNGSPEGLHFLTMEQAVGAAARMMRFSALSASLLCSLAEIEKKTSEAHLNCHPYVWWNTDTMHKKTATNTINNEAAPLSVVPQKVFASLVALKRMVELVYEYQREKVKLWNKLLKSFSS
ncbi:hypothetical protein QOT17_007756 [Balamuthia mandrillaris]